MLAGADFVTMGAGIPKEIPGVLDKLSLGKEVQMRLIVANSTSDDNFTIGFNPSLYSAKPLKRPSFLAIISSNVLAVALAKKANGKVDGFIIEGPTAGGHNAPPRSSLTLSEEGEPIYSEKDKVNLDIIKELNIPFWLAGGYSIRGKLKQALGLGAHGIQVGSPFLLCAESGLKAELKALIYKLKCKVFTNPKSSPTGFPFKELRVPNSLSEEEEFKKRPRICNLGYLRERFKKKDGSIGYRCAAEPIPAYIAKGGDKKVAANSKCLCNALLANLGLGNSYGNGYREQPLITAGDIISDVDFLYPGIPAKEIINVLLS
jgi:nitronate monooxygenase